MRDPTASVLIVGSEVLSAKVEDANGPWLARRMRELGIRLVALHTLLDRVDDIVEALVRERSRADWVFTSGGIGPTHDDVTVLAVALALARPVVRMPEMESALRAAHQRHTGCPQLSEAALRMADVPLGARLVGEPGFPTVMVENVVLLPGVPRFLRRQFDRFAERLKAPPFRLASVYTSLGEDRLAQVLDELARAHPEVEIGSYPQFEDDLDHRVRITLEGRDPERIGLALRALLTALPPEGVVRTEGP
jgi:molybdenum cofactor synthesis domain-containing protein